MNRQWQYMFFTVSRDGGIFGIVRPDGTQGILPPGEPLIVVFNRFGKAGWEVVREEVHQASIWQTGSGTAEHGGEIARTAPIEPGITVGDRAAVAHQISNVLSELSGPNSTTYLMKRPMPASPDTTLGVL